MFLDQLLNILCRKIYATVNVILQNQNKIVYHMQHYMICSKVNAICLKMVLQYILEDIIAQKTFRSFLRPLRENRCTVEYYYSQKPFKSNFVKMRMYVCAGVGKMKRRIKSKKPNWLVWQQLQQHRPPWRYWFIFFRNIFTTADATNDSFEQKYEDYIILRDNSTCNPCT